MRWWPFGRSETRAEPGSDSYTSLRLTQALAEATLPDQMAPDRSAAAVAAGGLLGRSLAAADVQPAGPVATALEAVLFNVGDWLVRRGECVFVPTFTDRLEFLPGSHVSISQGGPDPRDWLYIVTLSGPGRQEVRQLRGPDVLHFKVHADPDRPWKGRAPVDTTGGRALVALESALRDEAAAPHGTILPIPERDDPNNVDMVAGMIRKARGNVLPIETPREGGSSVSDSRTFRPARFGFEPPQPAVTARDSLGVATGAAAGIPLELLVATAASASREGFRRFERTTLRPLARMIGREVERKLDVAVRFDFAELAAADVMSRARATASLVQAGFSRTEAARLCGFDSMVGG